MNYLTPKKPLTEIARDRAEQAEQQTLDLYEAVAGLYEELGAVMEQNAALEERIKELEGGQSK